MILSSHQIDGNSKATAFTLLSTISADDSQPSTLELCVMAAVFVVVPRPSHDEKCYWSCDMVTQDRDGRDNHLPSKKSFSRHGQDFVRDARNLSSASHESEIRKSTTTNFILEDEGTEVVSDGVETDEDKGTDDAPPRAAFKEGDDDHLEVVSAGATQEEGADDDDEAGEDGGKVAPARSFEESDKAAVDDEKDE
eukprot:scaffold2_cov132-Skeletonema_menzelii.AAC.5